jgi:pyrroloquinoline quinone biosynthesis protein E
MQVAFGGGEAMLHPMLAQALELLSLHGLGVSLTSSGYLLDPGKLRELKASGLDHVQISLPIDPGSRDPRATESAWKALFAARDLGMSCGANVMVTRNFSTAFELLAEGLLSEGILRVNVLRPKPPALDTTEWFEKNKLLAGDFEEIGRVARALVVAHPQLQLSFDSSMSPITCVLPAGWRPSPIAGCAAGRRFAALDAFGRFKACSHLPQHDERQSLLDYWVNSDELAGLRSLEEAIDLPCGSCSHLDECRGCRAISHGNSADRDCPRARKQDHADPNLERI